MFLAELQGENAFSPGSESLETVLFKEEDIPWDEISFPMIERTLRYYFRDRQHGNFGVYIEDM